MKKIILAMMLLAFAGSQVQTAKAHGGWPIAAGVLGGLAVGTVVGESIAQQPVYYAPAPAYYYPPTIYYYQPAPATTYVAPAPAVGYAPAPAVVYPPTYYATAPVVSVGIGFGRPYWGGYYRGYHYGHPYYRGRW
jgi:hypothetical protein